MDTQVVLVTTTLYQSPMDVRFGLAVKTAAAARACGYPIIVADRSPEPSVSQALAAQGAIVLERTEAGMGASRRQAFRSGLAWNNGAANVIVWLEPEKHSLVALLGPAIDAVATARFDLIIPERRSLEGYPRYQAMSEKLANTAVGAITGRPDLDLYFGPRVMSRTVAEEFFHRYDGRYGDSWEIIFVPVLSALAAGKRVGSTVVDYIHPGEQTAAEERNAEMDKKRDWQRTDLIAAMARAAQKMGFYPRLVTS